MFTRTERWMKEVTQAKREHEAMTESRHDFPALFAPVLPVLVEQQQWYLDLLVDDLQADISGLALYDNDTAVDLPKALGSLPRFSLADAEGPFELLRGVSMGVDLFAVTFATDATDAGIALDFSFPPPESGAESRRPLGVNLWHESHAVDTSPLSKDCTCSACNKHSRAYVQHLLSAREMLAWVLLQVHNSHMIENFFFGVRETIDAGTFNDECKAFEKFYAQQMPAKTGAGPR